jgi:serine/threonine protein kinase/ActR/RegA family two-component response regulator
MTESSVPALDPGSFTLLVVDDVDDNRDLLSRWLRKRGFEVLTASGGAEALTIIETQKVDLVILDITMPEISGLDVLRELRKVSGAAELPVIMATARTRSEHVVEALDLGANDYVTKPIDLPILHARVVATLRTTRARRRSAGPVGPGTLLDGKYAVERKIGEGGFGAVYRAMHRDLQRPVAVKVLHTPHLDAESVARFRREGINACRVQHPNALAVLDSGITDTGVAYLVMELLEGHTLSEELDRGWISFARCAEIMAPVCEALAAAHEEGIVHRDIKPGNIFLHDGPTGEQPKVLDFGIAKLVGASVLEQRITVEGWIVGTPVYMAPERFGTGGYDGRSDVYAVGVLLHQIIAGDVPFAASPTPSGRQDDPIALATMHGLHEPPPLRKFEPDTPPAFEALVLRALAKQPGDRPTAAELAVQLREAVKDAPATRSLMEKPVPTPSGIVRIRQARGGTLPTLPLEVDPNDKTDKG